jgi:filamentous hemagglutinin
LKPLISGAFFLSSQAKAWSENGINRLALHVAAQGIIGGVTGGSSGALSSASGVVGGNLGQRLGESLGEAEATKQGLQGQARHDLINAYQETLAGVGGAIAQSTELKRPAHSAATDFN